MASSQDEAQQLITGAGLGATMADTLVCLQGSRSVIHDAGRDGPASGLFFLRGKFMSGLAQSLC